MKYLFFVCLILMKLSASSQETDYMAVSQQLLLKARTGDTAIGVEITMLADANRTVLAGQLHNDNQRKAFWINLYNGFTQYRLRQNAANYGNRRLFFKDPVIVLARHRVSLDDIEHGILRRSKIKWGLGYLNKWFPGHFEKQFRVERLDNRIHWALNCGARSCPPIAFYHPGNLDKELNLAQKVYLKDACVFDSVANVVHVPALCSWFRHDFGGKTGIRKMLEQQTILPAGSSARIRFQVYNWDLYLDQFREN